MLISFFIASVVLALTPGPDNVFVLGQSLVYGARAGLVITLGLCTGLVVHTVLVAFGVAEFLARSHWALPLLALFGAGYLGYLALLSWRAQAVGVAAYSAGRAAALTLPQYYRRGVIMNLTNPKVLLFFLAFLPQFVLGEERVALQIFTLGGLFMLAALMVFTTMALMAGRLQQFMNRNSQGQVWLNRVVAVVFALLALRLLAMAMGAVGLV